MKRTIAMLDTISNRIIVVFFLLFFALFALAYYMEVDDALELISIPFTLAGVGVVYFVVSKKKEAEGNIGCEYKTKAWEICIEDIDPEVRSNIDQYNIIYQQGTSSSSAERNTTDKIYYRSSKYVNSKRKLLKSALARPQKILCNRHFSTV